MRKSELLAFHVNTIVSSIWMSQGYQSGCDLTYQVVPTLKLGRPNV